MVVIIPNKVGAWTGRGEGNQDLFRRQRDWCQWWLVGVGGEWVQNGAANSGFYEGRWGLRFGICWGIEVPLRHPGKKESNVASVELYRGSGLQTQGLSYRGSAAAPTVRSGWRRREVNKRGQRAGRTAAGGWFWKQREWLHRLSNACKKKWRSTHWVWHVE